MNKTEKNSKKDILNNGNYEYLGVKNVLGSIELFRNRKAFEYIYLYTCTSTGTCMATISITITKEAYDYLKSVKGKKSFSETILSLKRSSRALLEFAGTMKDLDIDSKSLRRQMNDEWENRT